MKPCFLLFVFTLFFPFLLHAQGPDWKWAAPAGGYDVACDNEGNVYLTGIVSGTIKIGDVVLTSQKLEEVYLAKYDAGGQLQWAKVISGTTVEWGLSLVLGQWGDIYVAGVVRNPAAGQQFGGMPVKTYGKTDLLLAKFDNNGSPLWVKTHGGPGEDHFVEHSLAIDPAGYLLVTGSFEDYCVFGNDTLFSEGADDLFLAKYDDNGNVMWKARAGGPTSDKGLGIVADKSANVFVTGSYTGTADFGGLPLVAPDAQAHSFLAKYDGTGQAVWVKNVHGTSCSGIAADTAGAIYLAGINDPSQENFLAKYSKTGAQLWTKVTGKKTFYTVDVTVDTVGGVYFCSDSIIAAKYKADGTLQWKAMNTQSNKYAMITADKNGNVYAGGNISGAIQLGNHNVAPPHYLARLSPFPASVPLVTGNKDITLYPNPATGLLHINGFARGGYTVLDMAGRQVLSGNHDDRGIDISSLPAGSYLLQLRSGDKTASFRFAKQ